MAHVEMLHTFERGGPLTDVEIHRPKDLYNYILVILTLLEIRIVIWLSHISHLQKTQDVFFDATNSIRFQPTVILQHANTKHALRVSHNLRFDYRHDVNVTSKIVLYNGVLIREMRLIKFMSHYRTVTHILKDNLQASR